MANNINLHLTSVQAFKRYRIQHSFKKFNIFFQPLKRQAKFVGDYIQLFFFIFQRKRLDISCKSSAKQMIHMKCQGLFSLKNKK